MGQRNKAEIEIMSVPNAPPQCVLNYQFNFFSMDKLTIGLAIIGGVVGIFGLILCLSLLMAYPTMWAWNYVIPYLFELKTITFLQHETKLLDKGVADLESVESETL